MSAISRFSSTAPCAVTLPAAAGAAEPGAAPLLHVDGSLTVREVHTRDAWNALVLGLANPDLRQSWEWGELRGGTGGGPYRYAVFDGGLPVAALAATAWRLPGLPYSVLYASRGPVLGQAGKMAWRGLRAAIDDLVARTRAIFLRVSPGVLPEDSDLHETLLGQRWRALPDEWTIWNAPRIIMTLDLRPDEAELRRQMRESTRLSLTRALRQGARLERETSAEALERFHRLLVTSGRRKGHAVRRLGFFEGVRRAYLADGRGFLGLVSYQGQDLAGVLTVVFGRTAHLLYSCLDASVELRKLRAGAAAHWELIRWARSIGCERLDWGGAATGFPPRESDPGFGIYDFKRGFGCRLERLTGYYDLVFRPALYHLFRLAELRGAGWAVRLRARLN